MVRGCAGAATSGPLDNNAIACVRFSFWSRRAHPRDAKLVAPAVIASEAKQSISPRKERMDCFVAPLLAMTSKHTFAPSPRDAPEPLMKSSAQRGRGERRVPVAPAASRALGIGRTHTSKRVHRNRPTFPHAMVLTVSFELSPVTGLFCHRRQRICFCLRPVGPT